MKRILLSIVTACVATTAGIACNCGGMNVPAGSSCTASNECEPGLTCQSQVCEPTDGGFVPPTDAGNGGGTDAGGNDAGTNPNNDGGVIIGPDGGVCANLECRQVTCPTPGVTTTLTGKVYDPSGQLPLYNAIVYVPNGPVLPFTQGLTCDRCGTFTTGNPLVIALTDATGTFTLQNVPTGANIPLVIQIGKWRRQVTIANVPACQTTPVAASQTRLPRNRYEGDIPHMAIATGNADPFECLLLKMGIDPVEFSLPDAADAGSISMYLTSNTVDGGRNGPKTTTGMVTSPQQPPAENLWSDAGALSQYDVVLLPCEGGEYRKPDAGIENIVNYANAGGRLFVTHFSYVWTAFNEPFSDTAQWVPDPSTNAAPPDPFNTLVDQSFPKGQAFFEWLGNVNALDAGTTLSVHESRHDVWAVDAGTTRWLWANNPKNGNNPSVQHLTFNTPVNPPSLPDGDAGVQCGRVVFSDFHVTTSATNGSKFPQNCISGPYTDQEKALVFMLFDVSSCVQSDSIAPTTCPASGQSCSASNACCSGLSCLNSGGTVCSASDSSCSCGVILQ